MDARQIEGRPRGAYTFPAMVLAATARWTLVCSISIGLQLCCCNLRVFFGGGCQDEQHVAHTQSVHADREGDAHHTHCRGHDHGSTPAPHDDGHPTNPCDHHDTGGCACGTHDKAPNLVAKICLDISPVVIAILPSPTILAPLRTLSAARYATLHAVLLPPTSLLQQHCALIV
jgi:hypothetical protein